MATTGDVARYRRISKIGSGGMGTVDLAEDTLLGRRVALKQIGGEADVQGLARLRREALVGASFSHPNLVSVYDVISTGDGHLVIVMEYVEGETLRDVLNRCGRLPAAEALGILEGVAAGLDAINERRIVHRDVKPSNILLGADGGVKLADLGIVSSPDRTRITTSGSVLGSLSYMAPEQLSDAPATRAIDVYALSAVAFEMLCGRKARREANPVALAHAISTQGPPSIRETWPAASRTLDDVLQRGMARDPRRRPRSAGELVARLRAGLEPEDTAQVTVASSPRPPVLPVSPGPVSPVRPAAPMLRPPARRRRSRAGLLAAGVLALVAALAVLVVVLASGRSPAPRHSPAASHGRSHGGRSRSASAGGGAASRSTSATTAAARNSTSATTASRTIQPATATAPVPAVETFYTLAAAHRYADAFKLADPAMRRQLGGYDTFRSDQAGDRSITFTSAKTVSQTPSNARVAITTTSVRTNGTQHCAGTVDLVPGGAPGRWLLHQIAINCS